MLYKYRSLRNFKHFVDIILNQRLFASEYFDMNDPMEGYFIYKMNDMNNNIISTIKGEKSKLKICSLSEVSNNELMWAHYADSHTGVVIGVDVNFGKYDVRPVNYSGPPNINDLFTHDTKELAKSILSHKYEAWSYEQEQRIFISGNTNFVNVNVYEIILGSKIRRDDKKLIKKMINYLNPHISVEDSHLESIV